VINATTGGGNITAPSVSGTSIELIKYAHVDANPTTAHTVTIDVGSIAGVTAIATSGSSDKTNRDSVVFLNLAAGVTLQVGSSHLNVTGDFLPSATSGSADVATLELRGANGGVVTLGTGGNGFETVNISSLDAGNVITALNMGLTLTTAVITGNKSLRIEGTNSTNLAIINASTTTAGVDFNLGANTANVIFTGGSGNDRVRFNTVSSINASDTLIGGAGVDTLAIGDISSSDLTPFASNILGFEVFEMTAGGALSPVLNAAHVAALGINSFKISGTPTGTNKYYSIQNLPSGAAIEFTANQSGAFTDIRLASDGVDDVLNITLTNADMTGLQSITGAFLNTLNIVSRKGADGALSDGRNVIQSLASNLGQLTTVNILGGDADLVIGATNLTGAVQADHAAPLLSKVDASASAFTGALSFQARWAGPAVQIIGSASNDRLVGSNLNDIISGGAGNDRIEGRGGRDIITGGLGADTFRYTGGSLVVRGVANVDWVKDFNAAEDKFSFGTGPGNLVAGLAFTTTTTASVSTLTVVTATSINDVFTQIGTSVTASTAGNASVAIVTVTSGAAAGTYLFVNDGTAAANASNDFLVEITGVSGTITPANFVFE
jgi:Ca2+-binding RTX toxin-like protein